MLRSMFRNKFRSAITVVQVYKRTMSIQELKHIFQKSVEAVLPDSLIRNEVKLDGRHLLVRGHSYTLNKPCYVVGFGKAVLGMATEIDKVLGDRLQRGIVTVPVGIFENNRKLGNSRIEFIEGAKNNLPDKEAMVGAIRIKELVEQLSEEDLLIVLISGGGSALLPLPVPPITLEEKHDLIKKLAKRGADINDLNCVRKQISITKGGGLAQLAYPCKIISLILSDIIGDPLDLIASGPTTPNTDSRTSVVEVLKRYHLEDEVPDSIKSVLRDEKRLSANVVPIIDGQYEHVKNYIIGNNKIAAEAAKLEAINNGFQSTIVSTEIDGDVKKINRIYARLARHMAPVFSDPNNKDNLEVFLRKELENELRVERGFVDEVMAMDFNEKICLIFAGEPTVVVSGGGKGGRNQQLALAFSVEVNNLGGTESADISFLSCGTDGMDGPTDAAGAVSDLLESGHGPEAYLDNNDCYSFYQKYNGGKIW